MILTPAGCLARSSCRASWSNVL
uniref:Uncharacterized protein n=1 Tax=Arundo donax TaxID=35708 RepID=A0A0A9BAX3_ARUDO